MTAAAEIAELKARLAREMAELRITFNGRMYRDHEYRYERFADAVNYGELDRARAFAEDAT